MPDVELVRGYCHILQYVQVSSGLNHDFFSYLVPQTHTHAIVTTCLTGAFFKGIGTLLTKKS